MKAIEPLPVADGRAAWEKSSSGWDGEANIAARSAQISLVKFYSSWRCPFAHRVWFGLEEKAIDYQMIEMDAERGRGGWCSPDAARSGHGPRQPMLDNHGEEVSDSVITLEYLQEVFGGSPLLPSTPLLRARVRLWTKHVDTEIVPHFETLLAAPDAETRARARDALMEGLSAFAAAMAPETEGPFFIGDDLTMADIALAPFWQRMVSVLRAYRKFDASGCPRLASWFAAIEARPSFRRTMVDPEKLLEQFSDCADLEESVLFRRGSSLLRGKARVPCRAGGLSTNAV